MTATVVDRYVTILDFNPPGVSIILELFYLLVKVYKKRDLFQLCSYHYHHQTKHIPINHTLLTDSCIKVKLRVS